MLEFMGANLGHDSCAHGNHKSVLMCVQMLKIDMLN